MSNGYINNMLPGNTQVHTPLTRRQSDRGNYSSQHLSPRIDDTVKPTQGITKMVAQVSQSGTRRESSSPALSPRARQEAEVQDVRTPDYRRENSPVLSPRIQHAAASTHYVTTANTRVKSPSPERVNNGVLLNTSFTHEPDSPRQRQHSPLEVAQSDFRTDAYNGARPRTYGSPSPVIPRKDSYSSSPRAQMPMRMTQSDVILRERSPNEVPFGMAQSVCDSRSFNSIRRNDRDTSSNRNEMDNRNAKVMHESSCDRDYENVYDNRRQTDVKRPLDEHEDTTFLTCQENYDWCENSNTAHPELPEKVSALKICPACNVECSRMTTEQFQLHILDCFDNPDETTPTMRPVSNVSDDDRNCPMCSAVYPLTVPQEAFEKHVLAHFEEEPNMDRFEIIQ